MPVPDHEPAAWCVEEREIERLKASGRGASKKLRRQIGNRIRYWQRKLRCSRSISVPMSFEGKVVLRKYGQTMTITFERVTGRGGGGVL